MLNAYRKCHKLCFLVQKRAPRNQENKSKNISKVEQNNHVSNGVKALLYLDGLLYLIFLQRFYTSNSFLAFYGIIGGLAVMLVPNAVLYTCFVPMSIHAMLWHTVLVVMGVYLIVSRGYGKKIRKMLTSSAIFTGFVVLAIIGNVLVYNLHFNTPACQPGDRFSMFYISPYYPTELPLLGAVQNISYLLFVLCSTKSANGGRNPPLVDEIPLRGDRRGGFSLSEAAGFDFI